MQIVHVGHPRKNLEVLGIKFFLILEVEVLKIEDQSSCHTSFTINQTENDFTNTSM